MEVGSIQIDPVVDGCFPMKPTELFVGTTEDGWAPHADLLDDQGRIRFTTGGFLIRHAGRVVLVDLGVGPAPDRAVDYGGGRFMQSLARLGVESDDVTDVVLTHLHYDHIGWAAPAGAPTFGRATYRCHGADWDHFVNRSPGLEKEMLTGAEDRFELWFGDGTILPGVDVRSAPGHTPGSTVVVLSSGPARAVLLGDVVHCPVELVDDEWEGIYDMDPALARRTRLALVREYEGGRVPLAAAHFPELQFGRLLPGQGRRMWSV